MLKKLGAPSFLIAAVCGYLVMMTPDWKSELHAQSGYELNIDGTYKGSAVRESVGLQ